MSHTSRTVMAAMLATATARPERATDEVISGLAERLTRAINAVQDLAAELTGPNENSIRTTRLAGKTEGLKVALSYAQEIQRAEAPDPRDEQWQRALDMYGADAEHFGDCDQGGCNACILGDVHRIIYGVARPSTEG